MLIFFCLVVLVSFFFNRGTFMHVLIVLENFNVIVLFQSFLVDTALSSYTLFLVVLVIMTLEVSYGLVIVCQLWNLNGLDDLFML
uniref:NADH dehydrogenase subunit 4L n=1 Tax=Hexostoma thynni TaxID=92220 RepID=UPI002237C208|nr:NADH dehydrogenase subunit 4L [Hexostoma thynni]UYC28901.1 NADH dehydrogenase subunit 4L [Hexostoma thynni]